MVEFGVHFWESNVSIPSKEPAELGIFPWKWLFAKLRSFYPSKWNQQLGSSPDNWLLERSKKFKFPFVTVQRDWTCFENILLERSKCTALKKILVFCLPVYWNSSLLWENRRTPMTNLEHGHWFRCEIDSLIKIDLRRSNLNWKEYLKF